MPRNKINERDTIIIKEFNRLYNEKRTRIDDCINKLSDQFFLQPDTVRKIIKKQEKHDKEVSIDFKGV